MKSEKKIKEIDFTKNDISEDWIKNCEPLQKLEKKILLTNFQNEFSEKNIEVEFRILKRITNTNLHVKKMFKNGFKNFSEKNRYNHIIPFPLHQRRTLFVPQVGASKHMQRGGALMLVHPLHCTSCDTHPL